jgi:hypothetical protein
MPPALAAGFLASGPVLACLVAMAGPSLPAWAARATGLRVGGSIVRVDAARNVVTISSGGAHTLYSLEVGRSTAITVGGYPAGYADMRPGDHLLALGTADPARPAGLPNPVLARTIRISSTSFGGTITAIARPGPGATLLTVRGNRGHVLHIAATARTLVYMTVLDTRETGQARDLLVSEHIHASGTRTGKFELSASAVHVYPHSHTIGGSIVAVLPTGYRITTQDGHVSLVRTTARTRYAVNGKAATAATMRVGVHVHARGYYALHSEQPGVPTLLASYVGATVHHPSPAKKATATKAG